ncbi:MAG: PIN domain-containing protein, partial [Anaerolineaceae bacterium]|nr:PIN domain-containing protein [Anaerolineaceae bacterium]
TNIFLSFYHFTNDDLEELKKLSVLLLQGKVKLYLPEQVIQEFRRNRENKIADALKQLREQKLDLRFPQFCKEYDEFENLRQLQRSYSKVHAELIQKAIDDIQSQALKADRVIRDLFKNGVEIPVDVAIKELARTRMDVGNPPGKNGSLGDALNWEVLLQNVPNGEPLYFITDDKDYASPIDSNIFNAYLSQEWQDQKKSGVIYYKSLSGFFKEHFPKITLASELEKDLVIRDLANSSSFAETHTIISKLNKYSGFTIAQINAIVDATNSNNQVHWILDDQDVRNFFLKVIKGKESQIKPMSLSELLSSMKDAPNLSQDDDIPL